MVGCENQTKPHFTNHSTIAHLSQPIENNYKNVDYLFG